jgi:hypothetical protein
MKQRWFLITFSLFLIAMIGVTSLMKNASPTIKTYAQEETLSLAAVPVEEAPTLDGVADEAFWADAQAVEVEVKRGENESNTTVSIKSVYVEDRVYFLVTWADPTESFIRSPWELQEDGTWAQLKDPDDKGGDNNVWYEDKLAFIWPIANSIPEFEVEGCGILCHAGENEDVKPYGNKYTEEEGQIGDIWHWKSVRNLNQVDDQYVDSTQYSADTPEAGRHSDPSESGGYKNNLTEDKTGPAFMPPGDFPHDGSPGYILEDEAIPFDAAAFQAGDRLSAIIKSEIVGDRGDLTAGWKWEEGVWTLEFGRDLVTDSEFDVQFDDLAATYYFGVAVFDNTQVRHAYHRSAVFFTFQQ